MRKAISLFTVLIIGISLQAQNSNVVSAYNYMKDGDLEKAEESINQATEHEKTSDKEKTWRYRGEIYKLKAEKGEGDVGAFIKESLKSFKKAVELDTKNSYEQENRTNMAVVQNLAVNKAIEKYNNKDYAASRDLFLIGEDVAMDLGVTDTLAMYNAGLAAEQIDDSETALAQYKKAADTGYMGAQLYLFMANILQKQEKDEEYLAIVQEGRAKYPDDANLIVYELNYYLKNQKFDEAEDNLLLAIEKEPDNKSLHFSLGVVYDNLGNKEKAVDAYESALEIDPEYFDANYNLGALYFNQGVEMNNAANDIKDNKKYEAARAEAKKIFEKSLPYLEKSHQLDANDVGAIQSLMQLYALLGQNDKYTEMKAKLETK